MTWIRKTVWEKDPTELYDGLLEQIISKSTEINKDINPERFKFHLNYLERKFLQSSKGSYEEADKKIKKVKDEWRTYYDNQKCDDLNDIIDVLSENRKGPKCRGIKCDWNPENSKCEKN